MIIDLHQRQFIFLSDQMAHTKNVGASPGDDDRRPSPRQPAGPKGKAMKQVTSKKRKYPDAETARAAVVAEVVEHAERGGARSGVVIVDQQLIPAQRVAVEEAEHRHGGPPRTVMMAGRRLAIEEPQHQGEFQQEPQQQPPPAEPQPAQETQVGQQAEETELAPQLRHSGRTSATVPLRPTTQHRGSRPPPRPQGLPPVVHLDLRAATAR